MQSVNRKPKRRSKKKREAEEGAESRRGSWRLLPPDLATKILGLLPLHHAINAMAVCKQWRASLRLQQCEGEGEGEMLSPLFLSTGYHAASRRWIRAFSAWYGYHAESRRWVRCPNLAFLPFSITRVHSSHRGLLLVEAEAPSALYLCNFATQRHWLLPPLPEDSRYYWCHCHLHVHDDRHTFSVIALMRVSCAAGWPQLVRFDSVTGCWSYPQVGLSCASCSLVSKVFFEGVDRIVVLSSGSIYMMVPGKEGWCYLVKYDPVSCVWEMVSKLYGCSAQIVAFGDTLVAVALDRGRRQMHLYRLNEKEERLVLEESSGADLAGFVEACGTHFWYTTFCSSSRRIYVGVGLTSNDHSKYISEADEQLVEYEGIARSWRRVPLPDSFVANYTQQHKYTSMITGDAYHELGLATLPSLTHGWQSSSLITDDLL